jgi:mannose-6-phosphate isomerase
MKHIYRLKNEIQEYEWGSRTDIAALMGKPAPSDKPQAELWMGAHSSASSMIDINGRWLSLETAIAENPAGILGQATAKKFANKLPYLFKVLAAARPLSIQAHPNLAQAREGFTRENDAGIPLDAPWRNYKDNNHKPEIICALKPFLALNGFRKIEEILLNLRLWCRLEMAAEIKKLEINSTSAGLQAFFEALVTLGSERKNRVIREVIQSVDRRPEEDPIRKSILALHQEYPCDMGVLAPLYLNLVQLKPGQAMYLPAGQLHAYLEGLGMELMANSDNVLRGGLTPKHVDVPELLKTLIFEGRDVEILSPEKVRQGELAYATPAREFVLSIVSVKADSPFISAMNRSVEIFFCTDGDLDIKNSVSGQTLALARGMSVLVAAAIEKYTIEGDGVLYKAAVPVA